MGERAGWEEAGGRTEVKVETRPETGASINLRRSHWAAFLLSLCFLPFRHLRIHRLMDSDSEGDSDYVPPKDNGECTVPFTIYTAFIT